MDGYRSESVIVSELLFGHCMGGYGHWRGVTV
jgi:hypothetical protein